MFLVCSLHGMRTSHGEVAGWLCPRTDLTVPGMRTLQFCKERNGHIHVRIWLFWVTGEVTRPGSMFGCTDMALSPGSLHQRLHLGCGSCGARHRWRKPRIGVAVNLHSAFFFSSFFFCGTSCSRSGFALIPPAAKR